MQQYQAMNGSSIEAMGDDEEALDPFRQSIDIVVVYCIAYGIVFVVGLVGNLFVLLAVVKYPNMHSITNYLICNLAVADLLIIVFCLPSTLMVNVLTGKNQSIFQYIFFISPLY